MELPKKLTGQERESVGRVATKLGTKTVRSFQVPEELYSGDSKYMRLSRELSYQWARTMDSTTAQELYPSNHDTHMTAIELLKRNGGGVRTGFRVTGAVLAMTVEAYKLAVPELERSVEDLVAAQKNPSTVERTILMLAKKPNHVNRQFEESLCLSEGATELAIKHGDIPFRLITDKTGANLFVPDMIRVIQHLGVEVVAEPDRPDEQCPAQRYLPILWNNMVDICAGDPRFYQADLNCGALEA